MELWQQWTAGELGPQARILGALAPAILLAAYFIGGLLVYAVRVHYRGEHQDAEMEARPSSVVLGMFVRRYFVWQMRPLWWVVRATGLPANAITTLSVLLSLGSAIAFAAGRFAIGGWLFIFSGILDYIDGRLARALGQSSKRGAALDSMLDRYSDAMVLSGLAWFYRDTWVLAVVLVALAGSLLTSYIRAKGESLGVNAQVGVMQRAERIVCLGGTTALAPILAAILNPTDPTPMHWLAVAGLVFLAVSSQVTAGRRFLFVLRALDTDEAPKAMHSGRGGLSRSTISAGVATVADFAALTALVTTLDMTPWAATFFGAAVGAVINFTINRAWAFDRTQAGVPAQAGRYAFVSSTSAVLNAGGVGLLIMLPSIQYQLAWLVARVAVFVFWNYPLHRDYVFVDPSASKPRHA